MKNTFYFDCLVEITVFRVLKLKIVFKFVYSICIWCSSLLRRSKAGVKLLIQFRSNFIQLLFRKPGCGHLISKLGLENNANFDQNIGNKFSNLGPVNFLQTLSSLNHKTNLNDRCNISCSFEFSLVFYLVPKNTPNFKYV